MPASSNAGENGGRPARVGLKARRWPWLATIVLLAAALLFRFGLQQPDPGPSHLGRNTLDWARGLAHPDPQVRSNATAALRAIGPPAIPCLVRVLSQPDSRARGPFLEYGMKLPHRLRIWAYRTLRPFEATEDRVAAATALAVFGTKVPPESLTPALGDTDYRVRVLVAAHLGSQGPNAVPALREALGDSRVDVLLHACEALGRVGAAAGPAVPDLILRFDHLDMRVRGSARSALVSIGSAAAPDLMWVARDPAHPERRRAAIQVLRNIGGTARRHLGILVEGLQERDRAVRWASVDALDQLGPYTPEAVAGLTRALEDPASEVRAAAAGALMRVGPLGRPAVPALERCLRDPDPLVRSNAAAALKVAQGG